MKTALSPRRHRRQHGFALVDALIALLVMAFGMLAIAGFQTSLSANSDIAKQRSEAVRLAEQKIDELRSFSALTSTTTGVVDYANDVIGGNDSYTSNAEFTRTWTVTSDGSTAIAGNGSDLQKWIAVTVTWPDRTGTTQTVRLDSVISRSDPTNLNFLASNSGSTTTRKPKNRSIDIPYPATDFGDGTSGFTPGGATNIYFIFDNSTGDVLHRCTGSTLTAFSSSNCTTYGSAAYVLSGYIYYYGGSSPPSATDLVFSLSANNTSFRNSTSTSLLTTLSSVGVQFYYPASASGTAGTECFTKAQGVDSTSNSTTQYTIVDYSSTGNYYYVFTTYSCVVTPVVMSSLGADAQWFGQFVITTDGSWTLGSGSTNWHVCRFTGDYDGDNDISNSEHPRYYRGVTGALDSQNYVVIPGNRTCPTDSEGTLTSNFRNNNTELHQDTAVSSGSRPFGGSLSTGSQWPTTPEPSDENTPLTMGSE